MEPYVGSGMSVSEHDFHGEVIFVEVGSPSFAFSYVDKGRVQIGQCEFCSQRRELQVECQCKRVRYCSQQCRKKDETFHLPTCSA